MLKRFLQSFQANQSLVILLLLMAIFLWFLVISEKIIRPLPQINRQIIPKPHQIIKTVPSSSSSTQLKPVVAAVKKEGLGYRVLVPILLYHYIGNNPIPTDKERDYLSIGPAAFEEQMRYLNENGYTAISLDTLYAGLKKQVTLPNKPVVITFDDGYMDFYYNVYPILRRFNLHAILFIPTGLMNQGYYLTWVQIKEMSASGLITFGSHSVHHLNLSTLQQSSLDFEITESKKVLQDQLGVPINFMAYPYGSTNERVIETTRKAGYFGATGTWGGKIQAEGTIYNMPRFKVGGGMTLSTFISLL